MIPLRLFAIRGRLARLSSGRPLARHLVTFQTSATGSTSTVTSTPAGSATCASARQMRCNGPCSFARSTSWNRCLPRMRAMGAGEHVGSLPAPDQCRRGRAQPLRGGLRASFDVALYAHRAQPRIRRKGEGAPAFQFTAREALVVVRGGGDHGGVGGSKRLQDHASGLFAASGATRDLREKLHAALPGAEVGKSKGPVRVECADERHAGEVVPLGDHLGADQDIDLAACEAREQRGRLAWACCRVAIESSCSRLRQQSAQLLLDALGSGRERDQLVAAACSARARQLFVPTQVAPKRSAAGAMELPRLGLAQRPMAARIALVGSFFRT